MVSAALVGFLLGLGVGLAFCWSYVRILTAKTRFYETFIHERLDKQVISLSATSEPRVGEKDRPGDLPSFQTRT
jgi:hypothetical protein